MKDKDFLRRFLFENASVRGEVVRLEQSFQTIVQQHNYTPAIRKLLGEALLLVSLLTAIIKFKGRLTVQFQGQGNIKLLFAQCNHDFHLRGLAQWQQDFKDEQLLDCMHQGLLVITMEPETEGQQRYQGIVEWRGESLAASIEGYFRDSEQLATRIWLAVDEHVAAGLLLQVLPSDSAQVHVEGHSKAEMDWEHLVHLASTVKPEELLHLDTETLLYRLYSQEKYACLNRSQ